jgi:hypothetical protein
MVSLFQDLYLFGGRTDAGFATNDLWWYRAGKWTLLETRNPPSPRFDCSVNVFETKLILFGGQNGRDVYNDLYEFDIPSLTWNLIEFGNPPCPRFAHAAAFTTTQLWLFGGKDHDRYFDDLWCCDLFEREWFELPGANQPEARAWHTAFWIDLGDGCLYFSVFGGSSMFTALNDVWMFDYRAGDWFMPELKGDLPTVRYGHVTAVIDHSLYIIGGRNMAATPLDSYRVKFARASYEAEMIPQIDEPTNFSFGACALLSGFGLALFGGAKEDEHRDLWKIKLSPTIDRVDTSQRPNPGPKCDGRLSRPIFNARTNQVSTVVDDRSGAFDFGVVFADGNLAAVGKVKEGTWTWKKKVVNRATLMNPDVKFLLQAAWDKLDRDKGPGTRSYCGLPHTRIYSHDARPDRSYAALTDLPPPQAVLPEAPAVPPQIGSPPAPIQTEPPAASTETELPAAPIQTQLPTALVEPEPPTAAIQTERPFTPTQTEPPCAPPQRELPAALVEPEPPAASIQKSDEVASAMTDGSLAGAESFHAASTEPREAGQGMAESAQPGIRSGGPVGGSILMGARTVDVSCLTPGNQVGGELPALDAYVTLAALVPVSSRRAAPFSAPVLGEVPLPPGERRHAFLGMSRRLRPPVAVQAARRAGSVPTIDAYDLTAPTDDSVRRAEDSDLSYDSQYEFSSDNSPPQSEYAEDGQTKTALVEAEDIGRPAAVTIAEKLWLCSRNK